MQTASVTLLSNASATGSAKAWPGGRGTFSVVGTFAGATASLEYLGPDSSTWLTVGTDTTKTANGLGNFDLPPGQIRASITGGPPSGVYAVAARVPE